MRGPQRLEVKATKKSREEQIVTETLQGVGCEISDAVRGAVASSLKQIRRERYDERKLQKEKAFNGHRPSKCVRGGETLLADYEQRTLDLANRLHDMTFVEWERVQHLINKKFEGKKKELERQLQLSQVEENDL